MRDYYIIYVYITEQSLFIFFIHLSLWIKVSNSTTTKSVTEQRPNNKEIKNILVFFILQLKCLTVVKISLNQ